jgi:amino acid transporter
MAADSESEMDARLLVVEDADDKGGEGPQRSLGSFGVAVICFAAVAGGPYGIEIAVGAAGALPTLVALFAVAFVWSLPQAQVTAELSNLFPSNAGYVVWVLKGLGPVAGFVNAWNCVFSSLLNLPLYPVLFASYAQQLVPDLSVGALWGLKLAGVVIATVLNVAGVRTVERVTLIMITLVQTPFVLMPIVAAALGRPFTWSALGTATPGWFSNFAVFISTICWNAQGWSNLGNVAGEVKDPARSYPQGTGIAVIAVAINYLYPVALGVAIAPDATAWNTGYFVTIAESLGPWVGVWATIAAAGSCMSNFIPWMTTASRALQATAATGMLPVPWVASTWPRYGTPVPALLIMAVCVCGLMALDFTELVVAEILFTNIGLALQVAAFLALRWHSPALPRPYTVPGGNGGAVWLCLPFFALLVLVAYATAVQAPVIFYGCLSVNALLVVLGLVWARCGGYSAGAVLDAVEHLGAGTARVEVPLLEPTWHSQRLSATAAASPTGGSAFSDHR